MPTDFPISRMVGGYFVLCEKSRMKSRMACCRSVRVMVSSDDNPNLSQKLPKDNPSFHYSRHNGLFIPSLSKGFPKPTGIINEQLFCVNRQSRTDFRFGQPPHL